jgi:hypothetical protein
MIREYEAAGYFPAGDGRAPFDEQIPTPAGLRFPCDPMLVAILEKFSVKIHQLLPNSFLELSKFFWIMRTFRCNFSTDVFARLFELVIEPKIVKLSDGQYQSRTSAVVHSTLADRIRDEGSLEFRLHLAARRISLKTGILTGST